MSKIRNIKGQIFGKLQALEATEKRCGTSIVWLCVCQCGNYTEVSVKSLLCGDTTSCGCLRKESALGTRLCKLQRPEEKLESRNTSGVTGVTLEKKRNSWKAQICFMGRNYASRCKSFEDAVVTRQQMRLARDEFVNWWETLSKEEKSKYAKDPQTKIVQQQLFEERLRRILY